jgi:chemotaxis methyl-accepting protein methylase
MPGRGFHAVLLRNLFIYFTPRAQARMVREAGESLVPGGLLVLGRVERLADSHGWEAVDRDARIYRWKGEAR